MSDGDDHQVGRSPANGAVLVIITKIIVITIAKGNVLNITTIIIIISYDDY